MQQERVQNEDIYNPTCKVEYIARSVCFCSARVFIRWCNRWLELQILTSITSDGNLSTDFVLNDTTFNPFLDCTFTKQLCEITTAFDVKSVAGIRKVAFCFLRAFQNHQLLRILSLNNERLQFEMETIPNSDPLELLLIEDPVQTAIIGVPLRDISLAAIDQLLQLFGADFASYDSCWFKLHAKFYLSLPQSEPEFELEVPAELVPFTPPLFLPPWNPRMCLMDFLPLTCSHLNQQIEAHVKLLLTRNQLCDALSESLGPPLEVSVLDGRATWQLQVEQQIILIFMTIGAKFPEEQPSFVIANAKLLGYAPKTSQTLGSYPYSPRWTVGDMAQRMVWALKAEIEKFVRTTGALTGQCF